MELHQLRYFAMVAAEGNFTRAASKLHMSQPPLSRQIQLLEEELGMQLFVRTRPLQLTEAGRVLYEQVRGVLGRLDQIAEITQRAGAPRRALRIGFVASTLYGGLPALVRRLRDELTDVDIQLVELMSLQQIEALKAGTIDVGFGRIRFNDPAVHRVVVHDERLALAIPADHKLARKRTPLTLRELKVWLKSHTLIVYPREPRPSFADHVLTFLHDHGLVPSRVEEVRELQTALGLAAAEVGVCIIPASARRMRNDLVYRMLDIEGATSPVIMSRRLNDTSPQVKLVETLVKDIVKRAA